MNKQIQESEMPKGNAVATVGDSPPITPMQMLEMAVSQNADLDKLTKLMDLQERWEKSEAEKEFVGALNSFKAKPPELFKNKHVEFSGKGGRTEYDHATLDQVSGVVGGALSEHGISHRWEVEQFEDAGIKVTCVLTHARGHSERVSIKGMPDDSGSKNRIQQIASTITYLERYTLLAATGMATQDQDDDGVASGPRDDWAGPLPITKLTEAGRALRRAIEGAETTEELRQVQLDHMDIIDQLRTDLPDWYFGDGEDILGSKKTIEKRHGELAAQETNQERKD